MLNLQAAAEIPDVLSAVLADPSGALLDCSGEVDGEAAGAVHAFSARSLAQAGELLGLGAFERASVVARAGTCIIAADGDSVLGLAIDPSRPLAVVEKRLADALQG